MTDRVGSADLMATIHGTLVRIRGEGVLFLGKPGVGKSFAALKCMLAGDPLVADDVVVIEKKDGRIFGTAPDALKGVISIPQTGIFDVRDVLGVAAFIDSAQIDRCVEIGNPPGRIGEIALLGVRLPVSYIEDQSHEELSGLLRNIDTNSVRLSETRILEAHDSLVASAS